jgi:hypothetical protein
MGAYYCATVREFLDADSGVVLGRLTQAQTGVTPEQLHSWAAEIDCLRTTFESLIVEEEKAAAWGLLLEYPLHRVQRRLDAVLLAADVIIVIEFKMGAAIYDAGSVDQVMDYAQDVHDFHAESMGKRIVPILCASEAPKESQGKLNIINDVASALKANAASLADVVLHAFRSQHRAAKAVIELARWDGGAYRPVPTLIQAAEMLYRVHSVADIHAALANQKNLTATTDRLIEIIGSAQRRKARAICFVTGVPGSGKTLTGLNAVHDPRFRDAGRESGAFLSGNTPLVEVLREALAKSYQEFAGGTINEARQKTRAEIQRLMNYLTEYLEHDSSRPPHEHVIVFDEAQRAWDADYGKKKFKRAASEPTLFLEIMSRHKDWCVIIALVGGGQEINRGEGGLAEWGAALAAFNAGSLAGKPWEVHASPHAVEGTAVTAGSTLFPAGLPRNVRVIEDERLHLPVSIRSHRCEIAAEWVSAVLDGMESEASELARSIPSFPVYLSRSSTAAKTWLDRTTRGTRRCGLTASSGARRLRAYGLGVSVGAMDLPGVRHWYLAPRDDVRSSYSLELTANEYTCQGLELDRVGLCWGGDMTWSNERRAWRYRCFAGTRWNNTSSAERIENIKNTYRVLLTRAREAMTIWVPPGDASDNTRPESWMDETASYLRRCGVSELENAPDATPKS